MSKLAVVKKTGELYELTKDGKAVLYGFEADAEKALNAIAEADEKGGLKVPYTEVHHFKGEGRYLLVPAKGRAQTLFQLPENTEDLLELVAKVKRQAVAAPRSDKTTAVKE